MSDPTRPRTVLIVDDDAPFADFVRAAVEAVGHRAHIVSNGAEAIDAFLEHSPDLVFLDLLLPRRDGFQVCEDLRSRPEGAEVPVVMMTGIYRKASYQREGLERFRASAYLLKPFGVRQIWSLLEKHLGPVTHSLDADDQPVPEGCEAWRLERTPIAVVLSDLLERESCGVLFVRGGETTFAVYLQEGAPIFVRSNEPKDRLDPLLVKTGQVSAQDVEAALAEIAQAPGKRRLGQVLIERGVLTQEQLETALQLQLQLILNRMFELSGGGCFFVGGEHPTEEDLHLATPARAVLLRAARTAACPASVEAALPERTATLERAEGWDAALGDLTLNEAEERLLQLADGACSVERYLAVARLVGDDGPRTLLAGRCAGLIITKASESVTIPSPTPTDDFAAEAWAEQPFAVTLAELHRTGATGTLAVSNRDGGPAKRLTLQAGSVVAVESEIEEDRLADVVSRLGVVDAAQLEEAVSSVGDADDRALLRTLLERGAWTAEQAYWAHVVQARLAVSGLLGLASASLDWIPGAADGVAALPDVPTPELVWDGIRAVPPALVAELAPGPDVVLMALSGSGPRAARMALTPAEQGVLDRLAVPRRLADVLPASEAAAGDVRRTAWGLCLTGLAATASSDLLPASSTGPDFLDLLHEDAFADAEDVPPPATTAREPTHGGVLAFRETADDRPTDGPTEEEPVNPTPLEEAREAIALAADDLRERLPILKALRRAMSGTEKRVQVDRARMAELLDTFLSVADRVSSAEQALAWEAAPPETSSRPTTSEDVPVGTGSRT